MGNWINSDFVVPEGVTTANYRLRMLTVNDLVKDYDAVMTSRHDIQGVFGPASTWPEEEMSMEQDLVDLGWHQKEFQNRSSFAYTVMNLDESLCLGCVYIYPSKQTRTDAVVILWTRSGSHLGADLLNRVRHWIADEWPFKQVVYPGKYMSWQEYLRSEN